MRRKASIFAFAIALLVGLAAALVLWAGRQGADQPEGSLTATPRPAAQVEARDQAVRKVAPAGARQVLFGDLHVHTTYSLDAFFTSMPILGGEGAHPPADACDFARHCAALDFFSITDHASELTPEQWAREKAAVRQCNAVAGLGSEPDLVAFHGFEWTQIGSTADRHFGHKNVIFRGLDENEVPRRPITSLGGEDINPWHALGAVMRHAGIVDPLHWRRYVDFGWKLDRLAAVPRCPRGVDTRELPDDCLEEAPTPDLLFRKLDEWGFESLVIPHGNAWGSYTPATTSWDKQLEPGMHDPVRQRLIEVMSGHGNSERHRPFREYVVDEAGEKHCPEPTADYLPCCWQAGEIMRKRCEGLAPDECERRVARARALTMQAGNAVDGVFPGTGADDWLDCGQARSGFKPAYGLRPRGTVQYATSLSRPSAGGEEPRRFRFGFIGSSDSHTGRAATGYKPDGAKRGRTDMIGPRTPFHARLLDRREPPDDPQQPVAAAPAIASPLQVERLASFLYPGGTVAVHAAGRSRDAIWEALERREVYGTSGPRILLWFDLVGDEGMRPMGSEVSLSGAPRFRVRTVGSFVQKPGCPADAHAALSPERLHSLCLGECYHPGDRRHAIERIEVVRIRPQLHPGEDVTALIEDPWRAFPCQAGETCEVEFEDPDHATSGRDAVYYVRALQQPTPAVNGAQLRTRFDAKGRAIAVRPCQVGADEVPGDDCLAPVRERAWSSPIFVDQVRRGGDDLAEAPRTARP